MIKDKHKELEQKIKTKKAVIWDFDGVIGFIDWEHDGKVDEWFETLWSLLEEFDPAIRNRFANGLNNYYEHTDDIVTRFGEEALTKINEHYLEKEMAALGTSELNPNIVEIIRKMDPWVENFIWSNNQGKIIHSLLEKAGIRDRFTTIVSRDSVTLAKPNLDGFKIIRNYCEAAIGDFILVGDSESTDGEAARKLGIDFYLYENEINIPPPKSIKIIPYKSQNARNNNG